MQSLPGIVTYQAPATLCWDGHHTPKKEANYQTKERRADEGYVFEAAQWVQQRSFMTSKEVK